MSELKPEDVQPGLHGPKGVGAELAEVAGKMAELAHRIDETTEAMSGQPPSLMGAIVRQVAAWEQEKAELSRRHEELRAASAESSSGNTVASPLGEVKSVTALLAECQGDECVRLRARLRAAIRRLVAGIHCLVVRNEEARLAVVQVQFKTGGQRQYLIDYRSPKANSTMRKAGWWCAQSWTDEELLKAKMPKQFDLRNATPTWLGEDDEGRQAWVAGWSDVQDDLSTLSVEDLENLVFAGCPRHELP